MKQSEIESLKAELKVLQHRTDRGAAAEKKVQLLNDLAHALCRSDSRKAGQYARRALALARKLGHRKEISRGYHNLGLSQKTQGEYDDAMLHLRKALESYIEIRDKGGSASCYHDMGVVCSDKSDYEQALKLYAKARKIWEDVKDSKSIALSYGDTARIYYHLGDYYKALKYLFMAIKIYEDVDDENGVANCCGNVATIYFFQSDYGQALKYYLKTLKYKEKIGSKHGIALCFMNIGNVYLYQGDYEQALKYYTESMKLYKRIENKTRIAGLYLNIGLTYEYQGIYGRALTNYMKSLKIKRRIGDKGGVARAFKNIGNVYYHQGDYEHAIENHTESLKIWKKIRDKGGIVGTSNDIARVYLRLNQYGSALAHLRRALCIARQIGAKQDEAESYKTLSELHEMQKEFRHALNDYEKYTQLEKYIFNAEKSKQIAEMRTKYETEKREKELEIYELKNVELRKEIRQRRKAERELRRHRDHLEELVDERTAELRTTNSKLRKEIAERKQVEKELLGYQKQLRSLAHELSLVEERERRKIATSLHDQISQTLAIIKFKLGTLYNAERDFNRKKDMEAVRSLVDKVIQRTRSMTFEISPPVLYELGFEPAVRWLAGQFSERHGIACEFEDDGKPKPMGDDAKVILFQSVRELLANAYKHARARSVSVSTLREGDVVRIAVEDDGVGFDLRELAQKIRKNEGFGLFNLRERLHHLQGDLEIDSRIGEGTSVTLVAPLKHARETVGRRRV